MKYIKAVTKFETQHFDSSRTKVDRKGIDIPSILGFDLTDTEIAGICGAPTDSSIELSHKKTWPPLGQERVPPGVYFETSCSYVDSCNVVGIYAEGDPAAPTYGLYIKWIDFYEGAPTPRGIAARMLAIMVRQAQSISGLRRFRLLAAGGRTWKDRIPGKRWGGFYAWPKYGFSAPLHGDNKAIGIFFDGFPYSLDASNTVVAVVNSCNTVREVFSLRGGPEYWKVVGDGDYMEFDPAPGSPSVAVLDEVLREAGI